MMITRSITLAAIALLLTAGTCSRSRAPELEETVEPEAKPAPSKTVAEPVHYCDAFPQFCRPCPGEPGSCGGEPLAGACCCEGGGCVGVGFASDCVPACDFFPCEWGYQTEEADGTPKFICFDPED